MKDGVCPKCNSEEVYLDKNVRHGISLFVVNSFTTHPTKLYVCADCGFIELYALEGFDLSRVKEKFTKVKK